MQQVGIPAFHDRRGNLKACSCFTCAFGCGMWVFLSAVFFGAVLWYVYPAISALKTKPSIPARPQITKEDRKSLEEKWRTVAAASDAAELSLTPGEFNALLSRFAPSPAKGFFLERVWILPGKGKATFFCAGSGFWMPELTVIFELPSFNDPARMLDGIGNIRMNSFRVPSGIPANRFISQLDDYLKHTLLNGQAGFERAVSSIQFEVDRILLTGRFSVFEANKEGER